MSSFQFAQTAGRATRLAAKERKVCFSYQGIWVL
jgi:hypothetical protein